MTAIRDQRIWRAARGEDLPAEIDDSSTVKIPATLPGKRGGTSPALTPAEERAKFEIEEGFKVELFASEQEFPNLQLRTPLEQEGSRDFFFCPAPAPFRQKGAAFLR